MKPSSEFSNNEQEDREALVERLKKEAVLQNIGRLLTIFITLFAKKKVLKKFGKREGQEVQMDFPAFSPPLKHPCLTFVLSEHPSDPHRRPAINPVLTITFGMEENDLTSSLNQMVTKKSLFGLMGFMIKGLFKRTMKTKGSLRVAIMFSKLFLIGDHEMFNVEKKKRKKRKRTKI